MRRFIFAIALVFAAFLSLEASDFYWETPELFSSLPGSFPVSASSSQFSVVAWQESAQNRDASVSASGSINIRLAVKESGRSWEQRGVIAGPYYYSGAEPSILSIVIDNRGRIIIAVGAGSSQIDILCSEDRGRTFTANTLNLGSDNSVAPRIFVRADGGYILFITRGMGQSLSIYYALSNDAVNWTPFQFFTPESSLSLNFLPTHTSIGNRDIVFFQSLTIDLETMSAFQLYYKTSDDGGRTWTTARRFTTFTEPAQGQVSPDYYDNQRPHLTRYGNNLFLVWERRYMNQPPQIYGVVLNSAMNIVGAVERINSEEAYCNNPIGFIFENTLTAVWFDNRRGTNRITLAQKGEYDWQNFQLSNVATEASFGRPIIDTDGLFLFWQASAQNTTRIYILAPDRSAQSPRISPLNFAHLVPNRSERIRLSWNIPNDNSGIFGFSWSWSRDRNTRPENQVMLYNTGNPADLNLELTADEEGEWYFSVSALDFAGNWSEPSQITYLRKTTPPPELTINDIELDDYGYIISNNFNISWQPSEDPYLEGYTWNLQYLGREDALIGAPPPYIMGTQSSVSYSNEDNGIWGFSVSAIDMAGNIGPPAAITFRANKFIPYTNVSYIDAGQDEQGLLSIRLIGRGFLTDGSITSIVLSRMGLPDVPGNYNISSDREIDALTFEHLEEGDYTLRLEHSARGWYVVNEPITVTRTGTVKFGDYTAEWRPSWTLGRQSLITVNLVTVLAAILIVFCVLGTIAAIRGIGGVVSETALIKQEALAIITGDFMPMDKKQRIIRLQKRGGGLRLKLASFTISLVLLIVIGISTPLYIFMTTTQRDTLLQGLWDRSSVLLEGLASSARAHMPRGDQGIVELGFLPAQSAALPEARYVTITGYGTNSTHNDHVWATNDPDILSKIDTAEYRVGVSRLTDSLTPHLFVWQETLNMEAGRSVGGLARSIAELYQEGIDIALSTRAEDIQRLDDIQVTIRSLEVRLTERLAEIAGEIHAMPSFTLENIEGNGIRDFIFYKPIMYRQGTEESYLRGLIRLEVSLDLIMEQISSAQRVLFQTIIIVALAAILIGTLGALIFSTLIIRPIRKLVSHIEIIRDTEDKAALAGLDINIKSKDEIAILGNTINDMTHGLVKAALAASDLSIGKEIQKKFIPLELDSQGNKKTSGFKRTPNLNFFGYYEGAKGVSGDYFDYRELEGGRYYAVIKCDVAGKGIPAALIMIQVATMFLNYFKQWKPNAKGMHIEEVVYQINEFIETLGFKGRFAAFTLCLFDSETGIVRFCNAGDNIVHFYDASEGKVKAVTLPQTPATGVLPNFMIESTGGYSVQTVQIDKGDILLLYTDGIEEAKRKFRNAEFKEITCTEGPVDTPHENHQSGQADEEMTPERVEAIINAVMARQVYTLHKYHNPENPDGAQGNEGDLQFDFTSCEGRVEDVIMALVSVEKMFRCYKDPKAGEDSRVLVDKKVDEFLKNHFVQYRRYCSRTRDFPDNDEYIYYTHVNEDEQYDDLTILGIKRK